MIFMWENFSGGKGRQRKDGPGLPGDLGEEAGAWTLHALTWRGVARESAAERAVRGERLDKLEMRVPQVEAGDPYGAVDDLDVRPRGEFARDTHHEVPLRHFGREHVCEAKMASGNAG